MVRVTGSVISKAPSPMLAVAAAQVQLVEVVVQDRAEALQAVPGVGHRHPLGQGVGQRVGMPQALALHDLYRLAGRPWLACRTLIMRGGGTAVLAGPAAG